ncbi:phage head closure protein [Loktanella salsilacus]|uniref:phage head closure protein n=1 Tax=Loktanella salsilacus TaxID=195913 RepID=UPI003703BE67
MSAGKLNERVAFATENSQPDGYGGQDRIWDEAAPVWAEFRYAKGREAVQAGGLTGTASFKVRLRASLAAKAITVQHRMRDVRRDVVYNIREVDAITDRAFVWIVVESGVAV